MEQLPKMRDFEMFRQELENTQLTKKRKCGACAKRYDAVLKLMVLQKYYNLNDELRDEQEQVEDEVPRGAHLRLQGKHDEQAEHTYGGTDEYDGGDSTDQPDLQHVALRTNR